MKNDKLKNQYRINEQIRVRNFAADFLKSS